MKGRAAAIKLDPAPPSMRISNISEKGIAHIVNEKRVQVEFIMMSTKVVFVGRVLQIEQNHLHISLPNSLVSIERRKNARYPSTDDMMAFLDLSVWKPHPDDDTAAPFYLHQREVAGYRQIIDLSSAKDSRFLDAVGQSGHFLSKHYDDFLHDWHDVKHRPMRMNRADIEKAAIGHLRLEPRK